MFKVLYKERYYTVYHLDKGVEKLTVGSITGERHFVRFLIYDDIHNEWIYIDAHDCIPKEY